MTSINTVTICSAAILCALATCKSKGTSEDAAPPPPDANWPAERLVEKTIKDYLNTEVCADRINYIVQHELITDITITRTDLEKWYADTVCMDVTDIKLLSFQQYPVGEWNATAKVTYKKEGKRENTTYIMMLLPDGRWLINWVPTVNYSSPSLAAVKARKNEFTDRTGKFASVIGDLTLDDYYNYGYQRMSRHMYSFRLQSAGASIALYSPKSSLLGRQTLAMTKDGTSHKVAVKLMYNSRRLERGDDGYHGELIGLTALAPDDQDIPRPSNPEVKPRGKGWYCTHSEGKPDETKVCSRKESGCKKDLAKYQEAGHEGCKTRLDQAACFTLRTREQEYDDYDFYACYGRMLICEEMLERFLSDPNNVEVSDCEYWD